MPTTNLLISRYSLTCCARAMIAGTVGLASLESRQPAFALQPLSNSSSRRRAPTSMRGRPRPPSTSASPKNTKPPGSGPVATVRGTYTRNQYQSTVSLPETSANGRVVLGRSGQAQLGTYTITPYDQLDGYFTLTVPLVDVGAWERRPRRASR